MNPLSLQELLDDWFDNYLGTISEYSGSIRSDSLNAHRLAVLTALEHDLIPPDVPDWFDMYLASE
jgi:hypothetical protein